MSMMSRKFGSHLHPFVFLYTLLFVLFSIDIITPSMQISFNYTNFKDHVPDDKISCGFEKEGQICLHGNADIGDYGEIVLDSNNLDQNFEGMALYSKPIQPTKIANFTSTFSIKIGFTEKNPTASFFMSEYPQHNLTAKGYLGVADVVEVYFSFDKDLDKLIVGIHVRSNGTIVSDKTTSFDSSRDNIIVRVDYISVNSTLIVNLDPSTMLSDIVCLKTVLPENVFIGFLAKSNSTLDKCSISSWSFSSMSIVAVEEPNSSGEQWISRNKKLVIGFVFGLVLLLSLLGLIWCFWNRKMKKQTERVDLVIDQEIQDEQGGPRQFSYNELEKATDNFNQNRKLGQGGFGSVYSGFLKEQRINVAVKKISGHSKQGRKEYIAEVKIISQLRHKNLLQLLGWCHEKGDLLLVYELMENRSLDKFIFNSKKSLSWPLRYKISKGLAQALIYLHTQCKQCVVHRDVKSSNIMLDNSFDAKLGDFGLARLSDHGGGLQTTLLAGTMGYMAPECFISGKGSKESDVYAFGIVALEIVCGRKCIDRNNEDSEIRLVDWVWKMYGSGRLLDVVDERILNDEDYNEEQVEQLLMVGLWCAHPDVKQRPSMIHVSAVLNFQGSVLNLPKNLPVISFSTEDTASTSLNSITGPTTLSHIR